MSQLDTLSPDSKVWIYQSDRKLLPEEVEKIRELGEAFTTDWSAHGKDLDAYFEVFYEQFLVFFVDKNAEETSGCSIDRSVHFIKGLESRFDVELLDRQLVAYKNEEGTVRTLRMNELDEAVKNGTLDLETPVFNNLVRNKKEFDEEWELPLKDSWHARMVRVPETG